MPLTKQEWLDLEAKANQLRHTALDTTLMAGSGHIGGSLSSMDILTVLYYKYMNIKKDDPLGRTATVSSSLRAISASAMPAFSATWAGTIRSSSKPLT